jgi:hypothetical protein
VAAGKFHRLFAAGSLEQGIVAYAQGDLYQFPDFQFIFGDENGFHEQLPSEG